MGRHKKSTKSRRANLSKTPTHKYHGVVHDRAPTEAKNSKEFLEAIEENTTWIDDQDGWDGSDTEEVRSTCSSSSAIVCLDRGDEDDAHLRESTHFNMVLFRGLENWQKSVTKNLALNKRPRHYSRRSRTTIWRGKLAAKKNGQTIEDLWKPIAKKRALVNGETECTVLDSDSDIEEIAPPSISNKPGPHTKDATVASPESLRLIEDTIEHYHTLSSAPAIPTSSLTEPHLPDLPAQNRATLSVTPYQQIVTIHPSNVPHLLLHEPPSEASSISSPIPMTPLLAVPGIAGIGDEEIVMQSSWDFKKDRARAAEVAKALNVIVKARHRKQQTTNLWVQNRVNGMLALCQLFASSNSRLSWTRASELAAEAVGHGCPTYARKLRHWTVEFERLGMDYSSLPLTRHGRFNTQRLLDEDLSTKIHEFLLQLRRDQPYFNADDIVNFISTPAMQSAMGTKATTICKKTAQRWLKQMGWRYGKMSNGMYLDGHEREDVVEYRTWFLAEYKKLEGRMRRYDRDGNIDKLPELQEGERAIREVTHDESTFYANDRRKQGYWHSDEVKKPVRKDDGVSIMVADFLTPEIGRLKDEISEARVFFKAGKSRDGYWTSEDVLSQAQMAIKIFERNWPEEQGLFLYDNATIHKKRAPSALSATKMPKGIQKWEPSPGIRMRDGRLPDGTPQSLYYPDDHPISPGLFKGMQQILHKRGLFPTNRNLKAQCGTSLSKCPPGHTMCCCRRILYNQADFTEQKSLLQELYENAGHLCLYYPKFHCELNFIEQYWGNAKHRYRETALTTNEKEMMENVRECLDSVPVESIRSYSIRSHRFMDGYCAGLDGPQAAWACKKYHGHPLDENQQPVEAGAFIGANHDAAFQAQSDNAQYSSYPSLNFGSNQYHYGSSGVIPHGAVLGGPVLGGPVLGGPSNASGAQAHVVIPHGPVLGGPVLGGPSNASGAQAHVVIPHGPVLGGPSNASGARARVVIRTGFPVAIDERPIEHRREVKLKFEIFVSAQSSGVYSPEYCIRVPKTNSVKKSGSRRKRTVLDLELEVQGATTGNPLMFACHKCSIRESPSSVQPLSMIDFVSKEHLINVNKGKADIAFRFLCLPGHHGTMDEEYILSARILERDQVLEQYTFSNWFRVVSKLQRRRSVPLATTPQDIETPPVMNSAGQGGISNARTFGGSSSGTSAGEHQRSVRVQSTPSPAQNPALDVSASVPPTNEESALAGQQGALPTSATPANEHVAEEPPVLFHVNPGQGPTSGGIEIVLIVGNLSPTMKLFARFGSNIAATAFFKPGVLRCNLPPAAHPGVVNVTLCQAPSTDAEPYGRSLASFEYEADIKKAVSLLIKALNGKVLSEFTPLIPRLLQGDAGSPGLEIEPGPLDSNVSLHSSLPESAFLDILSALEPLPEFPRLLATTNEQRQTLLHLAIHLRYQELAQKLIHWGIDLNVRDVNGFTALHAAYLCDDPLVVGLLEAAGATPFVLDELGRSPTELAASIPSADGITAGKDEEMIPLVVEHINRPKEQSTLPDPAIPAKTQVTTCGPAAEKGHPSEALSTVSCGDLFHCPNPTATTLTAPQAINGQSIHVYPGRTQLLRTVPSLTALPELSAVLYSSPEQNGRGVMPDSVAMDQPTAWRTQQQHGESAPAAGWAGLSESWFPPGTNLPFPLGESHPSIHEGVVEPWAYARGDPIGELLTGIMPGPPQRHWSEYFLTPVSTLNASEATLSLPNHQVTSVMAVNNIGDMVAAPPATSARVAPPLQMSRSRTGRRCTRPRLPGQGFDPDLRLVQQRLRREGGDDGAINYLRSEIFPDGRITREAFMSPMSQAQRKVCPGTQKYMLLVERVPHRGGEDHRCLLCPVEARVEFKNPRDILRHLYKDHFGLSVDCGDCGHKFWLEKELVKHIKTKHCEF